MIGIRSSGAECRRHLRVLLDAEAGLEPAGDLDAARAHLEVCGRCRPTLEATILALIGLGRLRAEVMAAEPSRAAWECLRSRVVADAAGTERRRRVRGIGLPALSGLTAGLLVVALAIPSLAGLPGSDRVSLQESGTAAATMPGANGRVPLELVRPEGDGPAPWFVGLLASDPVDAIDPSARARSAGPCTAAGQGSCPTTTAPPSGGPRPTDRRR